MNASLFLQILLGMVAFLETGQPNSSFLFMLKSSK